jgi:PAS domain S-box-containing protein
MGPAPTRLRLLIDDARGAQARERLEKLGFQIDDGAKVALVGIGTEGDLPKIDEVVSNGTSAIACLTHGAHGLFQRCIDRGACDAIDLGGDDEILTGRLHQAVRVAQIERELVEERDDGAFVLELTQTLSSALDFRDILFTIVRRIAEKMNVERVSVVVAPASEKQSVGYVLVASDDDRLSDLVLDLNKYPEIRSVIETGQPLIISDATTHPILDGVREGMRDVRLGAMNLFPMVSEKKVLGVLFLRASAERGPLGTRSVKVCQTIANATAVSLRNARLLKGLRDRTQRATFERYEVEQRLRAMERYANLYANAAEGIAGADDRGRLVFANPRAMAIAGRAENEIVDRALNELLHEDDRELTKDIWRGFKNGVYPRAVDLRLLVPGREDPVVCSCSFAPLPEEPGTVIISFMDVTEQRRTEADLLKTMEFLESLVEASVDGIIAADMTGTIMLFNPSAERIYGYTAAEVVGKMKTKMLYPEGGAKEVMRRLRSAEYGGVGRLAPTVMEAVSKSGEWIPVQLSAAMIYDSGVPVATFGIFTDLREKMQAERNLAEAQAKLAQSERQALVAEVAGAAAHELNQPLTAVMACADLLSKTATDTPKIDRAARVISSEVQRMADIVKKIGSLTRYETKDYVGEQRILDIERSSMTSEPPAPQGETGER